MGIDLIASLLLGSSLSVILTPKLISLFHLNFFSSGFSASIPSFNPEIVAAKNYDLAGFVITLFLSASIFFATYLISKKNQTANLYSYWYLSFAAIVFLQTHFVYTSGTTLIGLVTFVQLIYWFTRFNNLRPDISFDWQVLANSFLTGFYLLLLAHNYTSVVSVLFLLLISPLFFYPVLANKFSLLIASPTHLFLLLSLFSPLSTPFLLAVGLFTVIITIVFSNHSRISKLRILYPLFIIFAVAYNPLFYVGNFDTVEEGFWAAWNQRLSLGLVPYRDFFAYHPPFLAWGLNIFSQVFGFTLKNQKLYFHLLQIGGIAIFYYLSRHFVSRPVNRLLLMLAVISFSANLVSNNFEIRLGIGLLAILFWFSQKPLLAGLSTAISLFVSLEVGVVTTVSLLISALLFSKTKMTTLLRFGSGLLLVVLPVLGYLYFHQALPGFFNQLLYYSQAFSSGYFNTPIDRQFLSSFLNWHIVNQYLSPDTPVMWELTTLVIFAGIFYSAVKRQSHLFTLSLFSLGLFRSALGRSDYYHLLPLIVLGFLILFHFLEHLPSRSKYLSTVLIIIFLLVFTRNPINASFLQNYFYRLQTYGKVTGQWGQYQSPRSGLLLGNTLDPSSTNDLFTFISQNTSPSDTIFVYPWAPEIYFLANRANSTSLDTPYAFFTPQYQEQVIAQLKTSPPKYIIYNPVMFFGGMKPDSIPLLTDFITSTYRTQTASYGNYRVLTP